jgi:hypothetical protein
MTLNHELFSKEQVEIVNKIITIPNLETKNTFNLLRLDINKEIQAKMTLMPEIRKYLSFNGVNNTHKFLCVKNKYFNDRYECIKCNNFKDFEDEKKYWINRDCEIKIFEINKYITEYNNILLCEKYHLYDWTQKDNIYKGYPRRLT